MKLELEPIMKIIKDDSEERFQVTYRSQGIEYLGEDFIVVQS